MNWLFRTHSEPQILSWVRLMNAFVLKLLHFYPREKIVSIFYKLRELGNKEAVYGMVLCLAGKLSRGFKKVSLGGFPYRIPPALPEAPAALLSSVRLSRANYAKHEQLDRKDLIWPAQKVCQLSQAIINSAPAQQKVS